MTFIKLNRLSDKIIFISPVSITTLFKIDIGTTVSFVNDDPIFVKETPEEILLLIRENEQNELHNK